MDGSATRPCLPELTRAACAVVALKPDHTLRFSLLFPVWRPLPQTSQAAEYVVGAAPYQLAKGDALVYSDFASMVRDHNAPLSEAGGRK